MEEKRKQLRRQIEELSLDERIEDVETASNNKYHYISENSIQTLLDRAREEGRKAERDRIFRGLDSIDCIKEALPKNYSASGMQFGIYRAKEIVLEKELSKLTTKNMEKKIKSKIEIKLTERERDLLYFYLLGVYSLEDIETFEEYPAVVDKLEESITEVAKSTRRRRGVESKLEKLERVKPMSLMGMMGEVSPQWVAKELNKIIDHLNSQDQEEENTVCEGCGKTITSRFMQSYTKGDGMYSYCLSCDPEKQDTPEEKEEWEFDLRNLMYRDGEQLRCAGEGKPYTGEYRELVVSMIKNLLSERERELLEDIVNKNTYEQGVGYGDIASDVIKRLDKLNNK